MANQNLVRVIPLSLKDEDNFPGCKSSLDVQKKYFLRQLPIDQEGAFYYRDRGLLADPATPVLFQCENEIIASAEFIKQDPTPRGSYSGSLLFEPSSIRVFEPVNALAMKMFWPDFKAFSNSRQKLSLTGYIKFQLALTGKRSPKLPAVELDGSDESEVGTRDLESPQLNHRQIVLTQIARRQGPSKFRNALLARYSHRCVVTGCRIARLLEAAHIETYPKIDDDNPANGLLLRADIHTLFDLYLLGVEPETLRIKLSPQVRADPEYKKLEDCPLLCDPKKQPLFESLQARYSHYLNSQDTNS